jgi:hypothetical protein
MVFMCQTMDRCCIYRAFFCGGWGVGGIYALSQARERRCMMGRNRGNGTP